MNRIFILIVSFSKYYYKHCQQYAICVANELDTFDSVAYSYLKFEPTVEIIFS